MPSEAIDQSAPARAGVDPCLLRDDHLITATLARLEPERHRPIRPRWRTQSRQPLQTLPAPLRLLGVLASDVPPNVVLLSRDDPLLLVERPLLRQHPFLALHDERLVAA